LGKVRPCGIHKLANSLISGRACGLEGIPNECLRHLPRRPLVHFTHLFNHYLRLSHFPKPWKEAKIITLPKPGKDPKFPHNLYPISLLSTTGKILENVILKIVQKGTLKEEAFLMQASLVSGPFTARHFNADGLQNT
jgi:hypothetical protein